ncbi:prepilin-type N-terminal cleavage/methylation domain-containing protein [bacterium]|nr:prepilin-type N-terminal cleavage/methylation domain-containing protein [bacterium]
MQTLRVRTAGPKKDPASAPPGRAGFSLVELLMVILIIAALMALILPAVNSVRRTARNAAVKAEINRLETAVAAFQTRYGEVPPSFLVIPARASASTVADWSPVVFQKSRRAIRKIWPQFDFDSNGGLPVAATQNPTVLSGAECLVLCLAGVPNTSGVLDGFSKNPAVPFSPIGENRDGPFYEFGPGRFSDVDNDGFAEYLDELPGQRTPLLYVSSRGSGYAPQAPGAPDAFDVFNNNDLSNWTDGFASGDKNLGGAYHQDAAAKVAWKKESFQIISPGEDGLYGDANASATNFAGNGFYQADGSMPRGEADNISNFSSGTTMGG